MVKEDREIEFISLKRRLDKTIIFLMDAYDTKYWSCETWASMLAKELKLHACEVSEDGENGAIVQREDKENVQTTEKVSV